MNPDMMLNQCCLFLNDDNYLLRKKIAEIWENEDGKNIWGKFFCPPDEDPIPVPEFIDEGEFQV